MREGWRWRLAALTAAVGAIVVVLLIAEGAKSMSRDEARTAIEAMPYPVAIRESPAGVLIGAIHGSKGVTVHFAVAGSIDARGIPAHLRRIDREADSGGGYRVWDDAEAWFQHGTQPQWGEAVQIAVGIQEALCVKDTGHACGI